MTNLDLSLLPINEADVEQKILYPLLTLPDYLAIPSEIVHPKEYLPPTDLDKSAGKNSGYYPDFSVWMGGMPVLIIEAKDPSVNSQTGFREACLYARHLNSRYVSGINPCRFVIASNGRHVLLGYWDQESPLHTLEVTDLQQGSVSHQTLVSFCNSNILRSFSKECLSKLHPPRGARPFNLAGGLALLNSKLPLNSFAADLSPVLRRYFSSTSTDEINKEIAEKAYVSSSELTEYDRVLEGLLKDRASAHKDTIVKTIHTSRNNEPTLSKALHNNANSEEVGGQLQIIQGGVGSGKSLFARRYHDLLEPQELKEINHWAFIDFNGSPASLKDAEQWLCEKFILSFEHENPNFDIYSLETLKGIFSRKIVQKKAAYELLRGISPEEEIRERAKDISSWQSNPQLLTEGLANYITGITRKKLVVVMDNVDKLELQNQLDAFQLSLWFMQLAKAFVILQMRDETYERFKNKKPLDTFRAGIVFHIAPPRFIDVVKRRLELGIQYLGQNAPERQEFTLDNGHRVTMPKNELGEFLKALYEVIFGSRTNIARLLEALSGRDVRKALDMFVSIVTSGHLSTSAIMSNVRGEGAFPISEHTIIKILMRTDYRFYNDTNGNIVNLLHYDNDWIEPDNFLLTEILYYLCMNRKQQGELGLEGYFSVNRICNEIQKIGYDREDVRSGINYLLNRQLIIADNFNFNKVDYDDCVKIQASGFIHLRILCQRMEYITGIIPLIPISENEIASKLASSINSESQRGYLTRRDKTEIMEILLEFLKVELNRLRGNNPFYNPSTSGAYYLVSSVENALRHYTKQSNNTSEQNELDLI